MRKPRCPVCGKTPEEAYRPFCSRRCADVDLQRWLAGVHRLTGDDEPDADAAEDPPER